MLPGAQAAAALVGSSNPEQRQLLLQAGSLPAPMQLEHTRESLHSLFSLAEGREPPQILPSTGTSNPAGAQLSPAQPCVRGAEAGAEEGVSDFFRMVGVPACSSFVFTDGAQVPLWMLLLSKKSFKR